MMLFLKRNSSTFYINVIATSVGYRISDLGLVD